MTIWQICCGRYGNILTASENKTTSQAKEAVTGFRPETIQSRQPYTVQPDKENLRATLSQSADSISVRIEDRPMPPPAQCQTAATLQLASFSIIPFLLYFTYYFYISCLYCVVYHFLVVCKAFMMHKNKFVWSSQTLSVSILPFLYIITYCL